MRCKFRKPAPLCTSQSLETKLWRTPCFRSRPSAPRWSGKGLGFWAGDPVIFPLHQASMQGRELMALGIYRTVAAKHPKAPPLLDFWVPVSVATVFLRVLAVFKVFSASWSASSVRACYMTITALRKNSRVSRRFGRVGDLCAIGALMSGISKNGLSSGLRKAGGPVL